MVYYGIPQGVQPEFLQSRPTLTTGSGGRIVVDRQVLRLWESAGNRDLEEILTSFRTDSVSPVVVRAALACLAEAGLLLRDRKVPKEKPLEPVEGRLVSTVIVGYNSREWLETCLPSLLSQNYFPIEIILVDNASTDGTLPWIRNNYPDVQLVRLDDPLSLAGAINTGVKNARGDFYLFLNPDVRLEPDAVTQMIGVAEGDPSCAAVAAKLKFTWAPAFLNGLGNFVGAISWGTDIGLGHLDLGQFDRLQQLPSACFAGALVPKRAWVQAGEADSGFPLYYEDSEWSYRTRLLGWHVSAAPMAVIYHAFSGRIPVGDDRGLSARKIRQVVYGRLRFASKLLGGADFLRFLTGYFVEDCLNCTSALISFHWQDLKAVLGGWWDYFKTLPELRTERKRLQSMRQKTDRDLFRLQEEIPVPLIWHGLPLLTWDIVRYHYLPLIIAGETRTMPELSGILDDQPASLDRKRQGNLGRAREIWRVEGFGALLHRLWKYIQLYLQA